MHGPAHFRKFPPLFFPFPNLPESPEADTESLRMKFLQLLPYPLKMHQPHFSK
jgi:hypothetical protein